MTLSDIIGICIKVSKEVEGIMSFRRADAHYGLTDRAIEGIESIGGIDKALPIVERYLLFVKDRLPTVHPTELLAYYIMKEIKHRHEPACFIDPELKNANRVMG